MTLITCKIWISAIVHFSKLYRPFPLYVTSPPIWLCGLQQFYLQVLICTQRPKLGVSCFKTGVPLVRFWMVIGHYVRKHVPHSKLKIYWLPDVGKQPKLNVYNSDLLPSSLWILKGKGNSSGEHTFNLKVAFIITSRSCGLLASSLETLIWICKIPLWYS